MAHAPAELPFNEASAAFPLQWSKPLCLLHLSISVLRSWLVVRGCVMQKNPSWFSFSQAHVAKLIYVSYLGIAESLMVSPHSVVNSSTHSPCPSPSHPISGLQQVPLTPPSGRDRAPTILPSRYPEPLRFFPRKGSPHPRGNTEVRNLATARDSQHR